MTDCAFGFHQLVKRRDPLVIADWSASVSLAAVCNRDGCAPVQAASAGRYWPSIVGLLEFAPSLSCFAIFK
jgi:hypothetical protein